MLEVPGIDDLRLNLGGTSEQEGVIDATAGKSPSRSLLNGAVILVLGQSHNGESVTYLFDEEQRLVGWNHLLHGQRRHCCEHLSQCMRRTGRLPLVGRTHKFEAGIMLRMAAPERRNQHGCVEELLHPISSRNRCSRWRSITSGIEARL